MRGGIEQVLTVVYGDPQLLGFKFSPLENGVGDN